MLSAAGQMINFIVKKKKSLTNQLSKISNDKHICGKCSQPESTISLQNEHSVEKQRQKLKITEEDKWNIVIFSFW